MKTIVGNNNFALINDTEFELDNKTSVVTNAEVAEVFSTKEQLQTYIASMAVAKFQPLPEVGEPCTKGKTYAYGEHKVKCLQDHTRMHYAPEDTPALFLLVETVAQGYPAWKQPAGGHDAYAKGDRVTFNGNDYESVIDANVWSPSVYPAGWKQI